MKSLSWAALALAAILAGCASAGTSPQPAETCRPITEPEVAALFDRWNQSLKTGDPRKVVDNYALRSILLPTKSDVPRLTPPEKVDYFHHFLENRPSGSIDFRWVEIGCNSAIDSGLYTFHFAATGEVLHARYTYTYRWDGARWLISSHHSSVMPEADSRQPPHP